MTRPEMGLRFRTLRSSTSTQGTTKEGDKDHIVRVAVSPDLDLELHKQVFAGFVEQDVLVKYGT